MEEEPSPRRALRRRVLVGAVAAAVVALLGAFRSRPSRIPAFRPGLSPGATVVTDAGTQAAVPGQHNALAGDPATSSVVEPDPESTRRAVWPALILLPVTAGAVGSLWWSGRTLSAILAVLTLAGSAFALRGPRSTLRRGGTWLCFLCLTVAAGVIGYQVVRGTPQSLADVGTLLLLALAVIATIAVAAWLVASWGKGGRFLEPGALALIAVSLTGISLQSIATLSAPLDTRQATGWIGAYTADPSESLTINISSSADIVGGNPARTFVSVTVTAQGPWALELVGEARIRDDELANVGHRNFPHLDMQLVFGAGSGSFGGNTVIRLRARREIS